MGVVVALGVPIALVFAVTTLAVGAIGGLAEARRLWAQAPR
jgi:hypothetical protein